MKLSLRTYYRVKPLMPRGIQIFLRRRFANLKLPSVRDTWPIDPSAATPPPTWPGWPDSKSFGLVLVHDVETMRGHEKCLTLAKTEIDLGFRSSFNFVPRRYYVSKSLFEELIEKGFEVGVHGLYHDGRKYNSREIFQKRAKEINNYLHDWGAVGFSSPSMHRNLDWHHDLDILYGISTFDTDPFEPQSDGAGTIFPFYIENSNGKGGYLELPYTLPQDFTLFIILKNKNTDIWRSKLNWIAENGGMVLLNTHPDYMNFSDTVQKVDEYPSYYYSDFLSYIKTNYSDQFWHGTAKELANYLMKSCELADARAGH